MTGFERNSDIMFAASYAPLLRNIASTNPGPVSSSTHGFSLLLTPEISIDDRTGHFRVRGSIHLAYMDH